MQYATTNPPVTTLFKVTQGNALHYDGGTTLDTNMNPQGQGFIFYGAGSYFSKMPETGAWFNSDLRSGSKPPPPTTTTPPPPDAPPPPQNRIPNLLTPYTMVVVGLVCAQV